MKYYATQAAAMLLAAIVIFSGAPQADAGGDLERVQSIIATLPTTPADLGYNVVVLGPTDGLRANTNRLERTLYVRVRPGDTTTALRQIIAHEVGHIVDLTQLTNADRQRWLEGRGITAQWWANEYARDFATGAGDFAQCYSQHATGIRSSSDFGPCTGSSSLIVEVMASTPAPPPPWVPLEVPQAPELEPQELAETALEWWARLFPGGA